MKRCSKCNVEKDLSAFHTKKGKPIHWCKICRSEYDRALYAKKREHYKARFKEKYNRKKEWLLSLKKPCIVCGESEPVVIDFHHLDGEDKDFTIGKHWGLNKETLQKEIDKCVCLCANCHRKVHAGLIDLSAYIPTT